MVTTPLKESNGDERRDYAKSTIEYRTGKIREVETGTADGIRFAARQMFSKEKLASFRRSFPRLRVVFNRLFGRIHCGRFQGLFPVSRTNLTIQIVKFYGIITIIYSKTINSVLALSFGLLCFVGGRSSSLLRVLNRPKINGVPWSRACLALSGNKKR